LTGKRGHRPSSAAVTAAAVVETEQQGKFFFLSFNNDKKQQSTLSTPDGPFAALLPFELEPSLVALNAVPVTRAR